MVRFLVPAILFGLFAAPAAADDPEYAFPEDAGIVDVRRDFGAKGDGRTDDTAAIQAAVVSVLSGDYRNPKIIYFPKGTYLVGDSIRARITDKPDGEGGWSDGWRCGMLFIGQSREGTVFRLRDNAPGFGDRDNPKAVIVTGSTNHSGPSGQNRKGGWGNEGFQNTLMNFTVDTGRGNPGAVGVDFLASNRGTLAAVTVRSGDPDGAGSAGVDLTRPWPGPALVRNVRVEGFDCGLRQKSMDCSMTYEDIALAGQKIAAIEGIGSPVMSLRKISSHNSVPVFRSTDGGRGLVMFIDSSFVFTGKGAPPAAVENSENLFLQRVEVEGYPVVVRNRSEKGKEGYRPDLTLSGGKGMISSYLSRPPVRLHPGPETFPSLPVKETPEWHSSDLEEWANVAAFGAVTVGKPRDFTSAVAFTRVDPKIDFGWGGGGPGQGLGNDNFAVRWTGEIRPPADGEYIFYAHINDNARLWVDGKLIIDRFEKYHAEEFQGKADLKGGRRVPVKLEYYESGHQAWVRLAWSGPGIAKEIVPAEVLFPSAEAKEAGGLTGRYFGSGNPGSLEAAQKAIDSGKSVVYFPNGHYNIDGTLVLRGKIRKLIGMEATLEKAAIRYDGVDSGTAFIEHLNGIEVVHNSSKTLVVRRCNLKGYGNTEKGTGDIFIDDTMGSNPHLDFPQDFWARQLNFEYGSMLRNRGGNMWVLGMKTEGHTPVIVNEKGVMEVYALYSMTNPAPAKGTPMIRNDEGVIAVSMADGGQKSYFTKFSETWKGDTKEEQTWRRETMMYLGGGPGGK